jgi:hypothetical protein
MSTFCDCPLVCEDSTKTLCTLCGDKIPKPLTDEAADRIHLIETTLTRELVLSQGIAPEHWDDADHTELHSIALEWDLPDINPRDTLIRFARFHVFPVVYAKFREEYGDLLRGVDGNENLTQMYAEYKKLGPKEFHKYLGKKHQFKMFCERFYSKLRDMYNIDSVGMHEEFEKMREKKQTMYQYEHELNKRRKR